MWPFIKKKSDIVAIALHPKYMTCCWLNESDAVKTGGKQESGQELHEQQVQNQQAQYALIQQNQQILDQQKIAINAYEKTEFNSLEFESAIIFNPTKIGSVINNFIKKNKIKNPIISIAITGPSVFEKIVTLQTSSPTEQDFTGQDLLENISDIKNTKFNYTYLCPAISEGQNIGFNFYICGITQAQLFQYKLLTLKTGGNLALVTTELAALIELYKHVKDTKFSQSQLAIDLAQNNYNLASLFSQEIISEIAKINYSHTKNNSNNLNINLTQESQYLATSLGLFLLGDKIWKK